MQSQSCIPKDRGLGSREPYVDGFRLHVQAVFRHAGGGAPEEFIAPVRAIPAKHVDFIVSASHRSRQVGKQIEQPWVVMRNISGAVVAQKAIQRLQRLWDVQIADPIHHVEMFTRMRVIEAQPVLIA